MLKKLVFLFPILVVLSLRTASGDEQPKGYTSKARIVLQVNISGQKVNIAGETASMVRGHIARTDLVRIAATGTDPSLSSLVGHLLPPGGYTMLVDRDSRTVTVWAPSKKTYTTIDLSKTAKATPSPSPSPSATPTNDDPFTMFDGLKFLRDFSILSGTVELAGHSTVNGHPATGISAAVRAQLKKGGGTMKFNGRMDFAEDLNFFPVRLSGTVDIASKITGKIQVDVTHVDRTVPAADLFAVPAGYEKVSDLSKVITNPMSGH